MLPGLEKRDSLEELRWSQDHYGTMGEGVQELIDDNFRTAPTYRKGGVSGTEEAGWIAEMDLIAERLLLFEQTQNKGKRRAVGQLLFF